MTRFWKQGIAVVALAAAIGLLCSSSTLAKKPDGGGGGGGGGGAYTIIPFKPAGSTSDASVVRDINDQGQAVGHVHFADGNWEAIHLDIATRIYTTLPAGQRVYAEGINNRNQIVGSDGNTGFYWDSPTSTPVVLPPLAGDIRSFAQHINADGIIIGGSVNEDSAVGEWAGVVWRVFRDEDGDLQVNGPIELPSLLAGAGNKVYDMNEVVDGVAQATGLSADEAVIWNIELNLDGTLSTPDVPVPLGTLGLYNPTWSVGNGINNFGDVCGYSDSRPFVAFADLQPQALSVPRVTFYSWATDINDHGEIVGTAEVPYNGYKQPPGVYYAYLWRDGARIDLTSQIPSGSGWGVLSGATRISNNGLIGGSGRFDVQDRGFIMIPNP